tara:strand:- start:178 stop:432 length:255 start_codon:yes stop_codon:yes gene_type:complete
MHYLRTKDTDEHGKTRWVVNSYFDEQLSLLYSKIAALESGGIPFEYQIADSIKEIQWSLEAELLAEEEMASEADDYDPEAEHLK